MPEWAKEQEDGSKNDDEEWTQMRNRAKTTMVVVLVLLLVDCASWLCRGERWRGGVSGGSSCGGLTGDDVGHLLGMVVQVL